jgi:hypothetical protein
MKIILWHQVKLLNHKLGTIIHFSLEWLSVTIDFSENNNSVTGFCGKLQFMFALFIDDALFSRNISQQLSSFHTQKIIKRKCSLGEINFYVVYAFNHSALFEAFFDCFFSSLLSSNIPLAVINFHVCALCTYTM